MNNETAVVEMPKKGDDILQFENDENKFPIPFVTYADFECFTKPMSSCCPNPEDSYNYNYQKHEPSGFCFYIKGICSTKFMPIIYTKKNSEDNVALIFVNKLVKVTNKIYEDFYCRPKTLILTKEEKKSFEKSKICHICNKEILEKKLEIIVILQVSTVVLLITVVILSVGNLYLFQLYFTISKDMTRICL